jgi:hypothetical protein
VDNRTQLWLKLPVYNEILCADEVLLDMVFLQGTFSGVAILPTCSGKYIHFMNVLLILFMKGGPSDNSEAKFHYIK